MARVGSIARITAVGPTQLTDGGILMKKWSILLYMAGDNNLSGAALQDLQELASVGSNETINIVVELDQPGGASRYLVPADTTNTFLQKPIQVLGNINTGDPVTLSEFITWGLTNYPAENTMLILWNHGSGWRPFPSARNQNPPIIRTLFNHAPRFGARWIGFDQTTNDALDMSELRSALTKTIERGLLTKFNVIVFDACLMSSLEVASQVHDFTDWIIASPYREPTDGWPYDRALSAFKTNPSIGILEFLKGAATAYVESYRRGASKPDEVVSISILDMARLASSAAQIGQFADLLKKKLMTNRIIYKGILASARDGVRTFQDREYVDITDFSSRVATLMNSYGINDNELAEACTLLRNHFGGDTSVVTEHETWEDGPYPAPNNVGFSVFYPATKPAPDSSIVEAYRNLEFTREFPSWWAFIEEYFSV